MADNDSTPNGFLFDSGPKFRTCQICGQKKSVDEFHAQRRYRDLYVKDLRRATCKACALEIRREWCRNNPEKYRKNQRKSHLRATYNLTQDDYEKLLRLQDGMCAICGSLNSGRKDEPDGEWRHFYIDHDHSTGQIRGLLCNRCNTSIGKFEDNPILLRAAADYLERHRSNG